MTIQEKERLGRYMNLMMEKAATSIGYPFATNFDYSELFPLLRHPLFNLGDPFVEGHYGVNSFSIEREVVDFFADLFRAPKDSYRGYVTSGGSESNLYALYGARERYYKSIVYYSAATHYSVPKSIRLLNMPSCLIRTQPNGEMDYEDLKASIKRHGNQSAIVVANIGTTMTEARDNVGTIRNILQTSAVESFYIHCDAALAGVYLSVLEDDPDFDFRHGADSIACSGHNFIGSPISCGVVIVKKNPNANLDRRIAYTGSVDTTITASRNGISPIFLWYAIKQQGKEGFRKTALDCLLLAEYTQHSLHQGGLAAWRNEKAITVVFPKPAESVCRKWQLATDEKQAHLICMPGISKQIINAFIDDLLKGQSQQINGATETALHA